MARRSYFLLVVRDDPADLWRNEFGDYDRQTVEDEKADTREDDKARKLKPYGASDCYKVVAVKSAKQAHVAAAMARLNTKES